ncbi:hypothetical protein K505DRAFT_377912 [Melanomma pulvis-pyrius CBS 109.77]|uniref:Uncharacterized protein n=1 Tax=Melanomma pulvis-pyrius CBS 109.77 TaxID=1314802 RepID=A0A6A6X168_9PLEO|nr:hypothetical protein K505DRAFT_377912 [Melanomma pulvis-pyrius CBS 109.77]
MAQVICSKLDQIEKDIFSLCELGSFEDLHDRLSSILTQISTRKNLDEVVQLVRSGSPLQVRRITFNIKKLCDGTDESNYRWQKLQALNLDALILCMVSFKRITFLPTEQFTWLVNNANRYLEAQALSSSWIRCDQVKKAIAKTPRRANMVPFLEAYYKFEIHQWDEDVPSALRSRKRNCTESPEPLSSKRVHVEGNFFYAAFDCAFDYAFDYAFYYAFYG